MHDRQRRQENHAVLIDRVQDRNGKTIFAPTRAPCAGCNDVDWNVPGGRRSCRTPRSRSRIRHRPTRWSRSCEGVVAARHRRACVSQRRQRRSPARPAPRTIAATTGSSASRLIWSAGVYVGFDQPHTLGERRRARTTRLPGFRDFMAGALKDKPATAFRIPPGIRLVRVDAETGQLARPGDRTVIMKRSSPAPSRLATTSSSTARRLR